MNKALALIFFVLAMLLVGCGTPKPPTTQEMAVADYGDYPAMYQETITRYMQSRLVDPESARYRYLGDPKKTWAFNEDDKVIYGYGVCAYMNSKNRLGGYGGEELSLFVIKNRRVVVFIIENEHYNDAYEPCARLVRQ